MAPMYRAGKSRRVWAAGAILLVWATWGASQVSTRSDAPDERALFAVTCPQDAVGADGCTVDRRTYVGWQVFQRTCAVCHAADAVGSSFAPNLLLRIPGMAWREFAVAMDTGYAGDADMAAWGRNPEVRPYYLELWAYLSARAAGELPPGEPGPAPVSSP